MPVQVALDCGLKSYLLKHRSRISLLPLASDMKKKVSDRPLTAFITIFLCISSLEECRTKLNKTSLQMKEFQDRLSNTDQYPIMESLPYFKQFVREFKGKMQPLEGEEHKVNIITHLVVKSFQSTRHYYPIGIHLLRFPMGIHFC